jgi:putative copper resistance protein D
VHFVTVGVLFYGTVLATDPRPHSPGPATRVGLAFLALPVHAFLGMALLTGTALLGPDVRPSWLDDPLADQRLGAGLLLSVGELLGLAVLLGVVWSWMAAEDRAVDRERRVPA